jgi:hypothetical protein
MGHVDFWSVLRMLICWARNISTIKIEHKMYATPQFLPAKAPSSRNELCKIQGVPDRNRKAYFPLT